LPISEVARRQYVGVLDRIADERGPVRADRVLTALKRLLSWHSERSDFVSPLGRGGRRTSIAERARSRILSDDELRKLWTTAEKDGTPFGPFVRFILLTATRRNEAAGLHRSELTDNGATWVIPADRHKSKRDVLVPLSKAAQAIVAAQPVLAGDFVFSAEGMRPLRNFAGGKSALAATAGVKDWRLHDLRRTARSLMSRAGVPSDHAERCLGHVIGGVRGVYDRHEYDAEKKQAYEALAAQIDRIVNPKENVVALREAAARR
jgi:integrase